MLQQKILVLAFAALTVWIVSACGKQGGLTQQVTDATVTGPSDPVGPTAPSAPSNPNADSFVLRARSEVTVTTEGDSVSTLLAGSPVRAFLVPQAPTVPISGNNPAQTRFALDTSAFMKPAPVISNALIDFGAIKIATLFDNDLRVCGTRFNQRCGNAVIRIYTQGAGEGLWNSAEGYGVPITVAFNGNTQTVGLNSAGAVTVQTKVLSNSRHVLNLSDLSPAPNYGIKVDFSGAGAGNFATTLVIEYGLTL